MAHVENIEKLKILIAVCQQAAAEGDTRFAEVLPHLHAVEHLSEYVAEYAELAEGDEVMEINKYDAHDILDQELRNLDLWPLSPFELELDEEEEEP